MHVEKGPQLTENHVMVEVFKYEPYAPNGKPFKALTRMAVLKDATIEDIKKRISKSKKLNGHSSLKMRLHERQRTSGVHPLMRDDKTLQQCVKQLVDGTKLCVRLLNVEETVTKNDAVVVIRLWHPLKGGAEGVLDRGEDVVVNKYVTALALKQAVQNVFQVTMGGVSDPLYLTKSFLASANAKDLKKKMINMQNPDQGHSTSMLRWVELPTSDASGEQTLVQEGAEGTRMAASDVGGLPKPIALQATDVVMSTSIGGLRDGTILFMHQGDELNRALHQWTTPKEPEDGGEGSGTGDARLALRRNPQWKSGGVVAGEKSGRRFPRRGKEVGIKIRTQFDADPASVVVVESPAGSEEGEVNGGKGGGGEQVEGDNTVIAGGTGVQAARLLHKTKNKE